MAQSGKQRKGAPLHIRAGEEGDALGLQGVVVPPSWTSTAVRILVPENGTLRSTVASAVGPRGVGKSTFLRWLGLFAIRQGYVVHWVDLDPGQPAWCHSGLLVQHANVDEGTLRTAPWSALRPLGQPVESPSAMHSVAFPYGFNSPRGDPQRFLECAGAALRKLEHRGQAPSLFIVNTCGWVQGMGMQCTLDALAHAVDLRGGKGGLQQHLKLGDGSSESPAPGLASAALHMVVFPGAEHMGAALMQAFPDSNPVVVCQVQGGSGALVAGTPGASEAARGDADGDATPGSEEAATPPQTPLVLASAADCKSAPASSSAVGGVKRGRSSDKASRDSVTVEELGAMWDAPPRQPASGAHARALRSLAGALGGPSSLAPRDSSLAFAAPTLPLATARTTEVAAHPGAHSSKKRRKVHEREQAVAGAGVLDALAHNTQDVWVPLSDLAVFDSSAALVRAAEAASVVAAQGLARHVMLLSLPQPSESCDASGVGYSGLDCGGQQLWSGGSRGSPTAPHTLPPTASVVEVAFAKTLLHTHKLGPVLVVALPHTLSVSALRWADAIFLSQAPAPAQVLVAPADDKWPDPSGAPRVRHHMGIGPAGLTAFSSPLPLLKQGR